MRIYLHSLTLLLCMMVMLMGVVNADETQTKQKAKPQEICFNKRDNALIDMHHIYSEYSYYDSKYGDGKKFPPGREAQLLKCIEDNYIQGTSFSWSARKESINLPSISFAKLFLKYGFNPIKIHADSYYKTILGSTARQNKKIKNPPNLTHEQIIKALYSEWGRQNTWFGNRPSDNAIKMIKLFLSLGVDNHKDSLIWKNSIILSLYRYNSEFDAEGRFVIPDEKYRADDIKAPHNIKVRYDGINEPNLFKITYFRTPVTYWLEEFIEREYPIEMLDSHALLYPRFMESASLDEIQSMTENPQAHKIAVNINCPYRGVEAETDGSADENNCPLTPSINMKDAMGRTPLHIAGNEGNQAVYDYLKNMGADASIMDYRNNLATLN